jgi:hypothetical protein
VVGSGLVGEADVLQGLEDISVRSEIADFTLIGIRSLHVGLTGEKKDLQRFRGRGRKDKEGEKGE